MGVHLTPLTDLLPELIWKKVENICQYLCWDSEIWYVASLDSVIKNQEEPNILYDRQSVTWLTSSLKLDKYSNISST